MLVSHPTGGYAFLPGIAPYSSGVVAATGFEIVHVTLQAPLPYRAGFDRIKAVLQEHDRPRAALCAVELRSPAPFTRQGFLDFNAGYVRVLEDWEVLVEGQNPVARTNVAPLWQAPPEPALYGFSFTRPDPAGGPPTFVVAGAGELRGGPLLEAAVIRPGETSAEALAEKAGYVMHAMRKRVAGLGRAWDEVTRIDVYTAHPFQDLAGPVILDAAGAAALHGLHWYPSRPPIDELEFEMDCRGVRTELVL